MSTQDERQINTEYAVSLLEQLKFFYEQQLLTDIVLIVEGTEFPCHKMVLATCSSYFRAMFMSGLSESKQTHVHLRNVDAATLQIIITYAYTGNLAISDGTVEQLYETACFLQVGMCEVTASHPPAVCLIFLNSLFCAAASKSSCSDFALACQIGVLYPSLLASQSLRRVEVNHCASSSRVVPPKHITI